MKQLFAASVALAGLMFCAAPGSAQSTAAAPSPKAAATPAKPIRHMVYSFTWGTSSDLTLQSSGIGTGGSGMNEYKGANSDQGTIDVDVLREQPDHGLVVTLSETAQKTRSAKPATCVVYGTTIFMCDPNKTEHDEELTLLRFLGPNFIDPALIDAKNHWRVSSSDAHGYSVTADYTITKNDNGIVTVVENRVIEATHGIGGQTTISSTIHYNLAKTLPTYVREYAVAQRSEGANRYVTVKTETVLRLVSDSLGAQP